jgi:hypothetical protein
MNRKLSSFKTSIIIVIMLSVFIFGYMLIMGFDADSLIEKLSERIFVGQVVAVYGAFDVYPRYLSHIGFDSLQLLSGASVIRQVASSELLTFFYNEMRDWGAWNVNGIFIHEAWANWGWYGIIFSPIYAALVNGVFLRFILSLKKTPLTLGVFSFFSGNILYFMTGFNGYIFNLQYPAAIIIMGISIWTGKILKYISFKRHK